MKESALGTTYHNGKVIIHQGEKSVCMYVIQSGQVEVIRENSGSNDKGLRITMLDKGSLFGVVSLFERVGSVGTIRSTVRALGEVRAHCVDKKNSPS